ncbi:MAG: DUF86 domain-containing protein [Candidatus Bathyarchaeota archaeon]|nr:DUF86 domain-containing protein [Candidatus Bathyarchaeota archaeon]
MNKNHVERNPKLYLQEIIDFIEKVQFYTDGMSYEQFVEDSRTIDAVDSNIRKIGEAVRVLAKRRAIKDLFYRFRIPYINLSDMRTDLTHEYFIVNVESIWKTTQTVIALKPQFKKVLDEISDC